MKRKLTQYSGKIKNGPGNIRRQRRRFTQDSPYHESMRSHQDWWRDKRFPHDNYIERFLGKNVGRSWSKVYSELCKKFKRYADREILHWQVDVEENVYKKNGRIYNSQDLPLYKGEFYVWKGILSVCSN